MVVFALAAPAPARAQDPVPPDTAAADTLPADTLPADTLPQTPGDTAAQDTVAEGPLPLVPLPDVPPDTGWATGVWVWDRDELLSTPALSVSDLLERIPSAVPYREGFLGVPEGVSLLGMNAGHLEVVLDGYVLDPLAASGLDLSRIELVTLERVRLVRRMDGARLELETAEPTGPNPYSRVEAFTGYFDTEVFRGLFMAPHFLMGPVSLGMERVETDGAPGGEEASRTTVWGKWGLVRESWGVQVEGRRGSTGREAVAPFTGTVVRSDVVLRGRVRPVEGLVLEGYAGSSSLEPELEESDTLDDGEPDPQDPEAPLPDSLVRGAVDGRQAGLRAAYVRGPLWGRTAVRYRSAEGLPGLTAEVSAGGRALGLLELDGHLQVQSWDEAGSASGWNVAAAVGPFRGVRLVGEYGSGSVGVPFSGDTLVDLRFAERTAWRAGAEVRFGWAEVGGGRVAMRVDSVPGLGVGFERGPGFFTNTLGPDEVTGWEVAGRVRLFWDPLSVRGWFNALDGEIWPYLPGRTWNTALVYDHRPLESGSLHIHARLEQQHRGSVLVPNLEPPVEDELPLESAALPPLDFVNFYLQIRILDVWAFLRWENILNEGGFTTQGRPVVPQRTLYGVKWQFAN